MTLANAVTQSAGTTNPKSNGSVCFERGPESMFQRVMIQDASGNLLESFENDNDLYCLRIHELLTNNRLNREGPGTFHGEGLVLPGYDMPTVNVNLSAPLTNLEATANAQALITALKSSDPFTESADFDPFNVYNQPMEKHSPPSVQIWVVHSCSTIA